MSLRSEQLACIQVFSMCLLKDWDYSGFLPCVGTQPESRRHWTSLMKTPYNWAEQSGSTLPLTLSLAGTQALCGLTVISIEVTNCSSTGRACWCWCGPVLQQVWGPYPSWCLTPAMPPSYFQICSCYILSLWWILVSLAKKHFSFKPDRLSYL